MLIYVNNFTKPDVFCVLSVPLELFTSSLLSLQLKGINSTVGFSLEITKMSLLALVGLYIWFLYCKVSYL